MTGVIFLSDSDLCPVIRKGNFVGWWVMICPLDKSWFEKGKYFDKTSPDGQVNAPERVSQLRMGEVIHFCQWRTIILI